MSYLSLYRKWRPQTFADVVGQEHVVRTLRNALDMGRCAHAYIFSGPRGTGKTTLARLLAKGLNCQQGPTGNWCNTCENCQRISKGHSVDVIEIDGASNRGIDEIRDVREKVKFAPAEGRYKVYIIDEVHMLTQEAFNALLKVLEEPPAHVVFIFATTEAYRIPATIVSRCQKFDFYGFSPDQVADQIRRVAKAEGVQIDEGSIYLIARHAAGGMRDALGFLDQCISFAEEGISESLVAQVLGVVEQEQLQELARGVAQGDVAKCLTIVKDVVDRGRDLRQFARDAVQFFRDLMLLKAVPGREGLVVLGGEDFKAAQELAASFEVTHLLRIVERLGQAEADMRWAQIAQLPLEIALIELLRGDDQVNEPQATGDLVAASTVRQLMERIEALEARIASGTQIASGAQSPTRPTTQSTSPVAAAPPAPTPPAPSQSDSSPSAPEPPSTAPASSSVTQVPSVSASAKQPSQPPQMETAPTAQGDFLHRVQSEWQQVLDYLRSSKYIQQEAFLREGVPGTYEDGVLTIYFSPNHRFHQANIAQEKNKSIVEQAIKRVFNEDVTLNVVLGEVPQSAEGVQTASLEPSDPPMPSSSSVDPSASKGHAQAGPIQVEPMPVQSTQEVSRSESKGTQVENVSKEPAATGEGLEIDPSEIDDPLLKAALELFGGTITRLEREEVNEP